MHRDIKSTNILLDDNCHAKVSDFGLAKLCDDVRHNSQDDAGDQSSGDAASSASSLTRGLHTVGCGTYRYMAPEVARPRFGRRGHSEYDHRCDVYSFGLLLWEVMHQSAPFADKQHKEAALAVVRGERPPIALPSERTSFVPIITKCWSQDPLERPAMLNVTQRLIEVEATLVARAGSAAPTSTADAPLPSLVGSCSSQVSTSGILRSCHTAKLCEGAVMATPDGGASDAKDRHACAQYDAPIVEPVAEPPLPGLHVVLESADTHQPSTPVTAAGKRSVPDIDAMWAAIQRMERPVGVSESESFSYAASVVDSSSS